MTEGAFRRDIDDAQNVVRWPRLKRFLLDAVSLAPIGSALEQVTGPLVSVLMLHRFADATIGSTGADPGRVASMIRSLRRSGVTFVALHEIVDAIAAGDPVPPRAVAITIDDGYRDVLTVGASAILGAGAPLTLFVTTGFVDQTMWMWWDRIRVLVTRAPAMRVVLASHGFHFSAHWTRETAAGEARRIIRAFEFLPGEVRLGLIAHLEEVVGTRLPTRPEDRYAALSWDEVRSLAAAGVSIAAHSVTHPILSCVDDAQAHFEIATSWSRLREEVASPSSIFCYPNGTAAAWGQREEVMVREAGMSGAMSAEFGYLNRAYASRGAYALPRFPCDDDPSEAMQYVSGLWKFRFPGEA